jgi:hypothetical protein
VSIYKEVLRNLEEINGQVRKVGEVMVDIAAASEQQTHGVDQVNRAVEQMNQITQQTATNAEESADEARELSGQAENLRQVVKGFQLSRTRGGSNRQPGGDAIAAVPPGAGRLRAKVPGRIIPIAAKMRKRDAAEVDAVDEPM